jgi:hypothetical protein
VGHARLHLLNRKLAVLMGLVALGLVLFLNVDSGRTPPRPPLAHGGGGPPSQTLAFAFSPDGTTIATIHEDGRVLLRRPPGSWRLKRFLNYRGFARALAFSPDSRFLALGGFEPGITLCDLSGEGTERPLNVTI